MSRRAPRASTRASAAAKLGEELFDGTSALPQEELSPASSWQPTVPLQLVDPRSTFASPEQPSFLPPHAYDCTNSDTCKAFYDYVNETRPEILYATLPPAEVSYLCSYDTPGSQGKRCTVLQSGDRALWIRRNRTYTGYCLLHDEKDTHKVRLAEQVNRFREFRQSQVQRICETHFGSTRNLFSGRYSHLNVMYWRDESEIIANTTNVNYYIGDDMVADKFLPPKAIDLADPESCAEFDRYVKVANPDWFYTTMPRLSKPRRCQYSNCPPPEYNSRQCPLKVPSGSQALLQREGSEYTLWCLGHDTQEVLTENANRQEHNLRSHLRIDRRRTATSQGNTAGTSGLSDPAVENDEDLLQHFRAHYGGDGYPVKLEDADDQR